MTRSRRADRAACALALGLGVASACGGRSLSLGGDPLALSGGATAGVSSSGGSAGSGSGAGPATGGTGGSGGGIVITGGASGSGGDGAVTGGMGGVGENAYPPVSWQNGQGYRDVCPEYADTSGFTCWHHESGVGTTCALDGSPLCNACSCAIPCDEPSDCPSGPGGELAGCFGSDTNVMSCFLTCDGTACPLGMDCSTYPGTTSRVCMWLPPSSGMGTPK